MTKSDQSNPLLNREMPDHFDEFDQGVFSKISFPFGQDEVAITHAINDLLKEGWAFSLTKSHIVMSRQWEVTSGFPLEPKLR